MTHQRQLKTTFTELGIKFEEKGNHIISNGVDYEFKEGKFVSVNESKPKKEVKDK